jgi:HK97 family phage major capsid protein
MSRLKALKDERGEVLETLQNIDAEASKAKRSLTEEEQTQWDEADARLAELDKEIARAEKAEQINARLAATAGQKLNEDTSEKKELKQFSLIRFIRGAADHNLQGFEKEMHQEAEKEAREMGFDIKNYGIPSRVMGVNRDNTVTGGTQPADGAQLVKKDERGMIDILKDAQVLRSLGATFLTGLKGNVSFDELTQTATSTWKSENAVLDKSQLKFSGREMSPKRLGTLATPSKQLLIQSSYDVEMMLRREIMESVAIAVDRAGINGSGAANEPLGLLNTAGIGSVAIGTLGGAPDYKHIVGLENAVEIENALEGNLKFLSNPKVRAKLKLTKLDAGSGQFLMPSRNELIGYDFVASNGIPSNLTKTDGTTTATDLSAILFGNWSDLLIGQWGGLDILADPYTLADTGKIRIIVDSFWDVFVRRAVSFAAIKDADTTLA